jgi:hypothetical protein
MGIATRVKERVMDDLSSPSAKRTSHWPTLVSREMPMRFRVSIVVGTLFLTGCNANQEVNLSSRSARGIVAGPDYNPYNPISYAQNNTGNRSGGR